MKNAFNIISVEKTLTVMSHAPEHKKEWMNLINEQLNRAPKPGRGSFIASSSESSESSAQDGDVYTLSATITGADTLFDANGRGFTVHSPLFCFPFPSFSSFLTYFSSASLSPARKYLFSLLAFLIAASFEVWT